MAEGDTLAFSDPDGYAASFGDVRINLTITGAGDFQAKRTRLKLNALEIYQCCEGLPRIAYISLPPGRIFCSFASGKASPICDGFAVGNREIALHGHGGHLHQRTLGECQWGLISSATDQLSSCSKALIERPFLPPPASRILRPSGAAAALFVRLHTEACHLARSRKLIEHPEIARALEQQMLHAIVHALTASDADDDSKARHHHAAIMARFEAALRRHFDQKLTMPALCEEVGVPERTLRMCCAEFLGVSPMRYLLLQRLNKARSALRRADRSTTSVAEIARNHQFLELGRFAVIYRTTFGESPSATLQRHA